MHNHQNAMRCYFPILLLALTGCVSTEKIQPVESSKATPNLMVSKSAAQSEDDEPTLPQQVYITLTYWAGIETNYSQIQHSTDLIHWEIYPEIYFGAPSTNYPDLVAIGSAGFYRAVKVDPL